MYVYYTASSGKVMNYKHVVFMYAYYTPSSGKVMNYKTCGVHL